MARIPPIIHTLSRGDALIVPIHLRQRIHITPGQPVLVSFIEREGHVLALAAFTILLARARTSAGTAAHETTTTTSPGAPWPHQTVTHRYHHPQTGVHLTLTTTWTARYRPQDGTWHDVQGTVTTTQQSDTFNLVDTTTHLTDHAEHKQGH